MSRRYSSGIETMATANQAFLLNFISRPHCPCEDDEYYTPALSRECNRDFSTTTQERVRFSLCIVTRIFTVEVPSQHPDKCINGKEQHKAEQDGKLSLTATKISDLLYPSMNEEKMNGRRDY